MPRLLLTLVVFLCAIVVFAQQKRDFRSEVQGLRKVLAQQHVQQQPINDKFSEMLFSSFIDELDPQHLYFTTADLITIDKHRKLLDNEIMGDGWNFLNQITPLYQKVLARAKAIVQKQSAVPFTENSKEVYQSDTTWSANEQELNTRWRTWLYYSTLGNLSQTQKAQAPISFIKSEPDARSRTVRYELRKISRRMDTKDGIGTYLAEAFLNSIVLLYDPHSQFFNVTSLDLFMTSMSAEGYYYGLSLKENERGVITVASLAPGGPAWKSGMFSVGDELTALRWENEEAMDLAEITLDEANEILSDHNQSLLEFTLHKSNGEVKVVQLRREKLSQEQKLVRSYVMVGANGKKFGYIVLPDFYTKWGNASEGSRCANDVAREILKLNPEKIEGLILDVRYNGGGSLLEAIALSGIFIDAGAMAMMHKYNEEPKNLKDVNRGTVYDGPMVLMVNTQSASASELLAAVLQDYNRAVIVGSRTFGKATGQEFFPLDEAKIKSNLEKGNVGFAKVTTSRLYRVTGKSLQGKGVTPDVELPDLYDLLNYHESTRPHYLHGDSIQKKSYYIPLPSLPLSALRQKSEERIKTEKYFQAVEQSMFLLKPLIENKKEPVALTWENIQRRAAARKNILELLRIAGDENRNDFQMKTGIADQQRLELDAFSKAFNEAWLSDMQKDPYLGEAFRIINDLTVLNKKK